VTKQRRHQEKRKKAGLCAREGCTEDPRGATRCHTHATEHAAVMKRYRLRKKGQEVALAI